jgi:hypothetical protein
MLHTNLDWLHKPTARSTPVSGSDVYMFAPQTDRTMVCVSIPIDVRVTLLACKIFFCTLESFRFHCGR